MVTVDYLRTLAAYNRWQNESLYREASKLSDDARRADRGAFFGSIHATLNHILWADRIWMSRLASWPAPRVNSIGESVNECPDWESLRTARKDMDAQLCAWAAALTPTDLDGDLTWYSFGVSRNVTKSRALLHAHLFNHQVHHRGQVHAMLTAAGAHPDNTDLPFTPETSF